MTQHLEVEVGTPPPFLMFATASAGSHPVAHSKWQGAGQWRDPGAAVVAVEETLKH